MASSPTVAEPAITIPFGRPMIGETERRAVLDVLDGPILVHGRRIREFEDAFARWTGAPHAVAASSCTAAMHLIYLAWGIGAGDEVIVPALTHVATAHAVVHAGARPVFVDVDPRTGNIDVGRIEAAISPRTRAVAVVHFLGVPVDMAGVLEITRRHDLKVLEDCALALGTRVDDVHAGLLGDAGAFSFYPVKHITTSEGGMVVARDGETADKAARLRSFGYERAVDTPAHDYDVTLPGYNFRMSEMEAAIGSAQLERLDDFLAARDANFSILSERVREIDGVSTFDEPPPGARSSRYCLSARIDGAARGDRDRVIASLKKMGVGCSVYYPRPVPLMSWYRRSLDVRSDDFKVASALADTTVALPVGPHLTEADMHRVADALEIAVTEIRS